MINVSKKFGLIAVSSRKTEVVADREHFPKCTWFRYSRLVQGDEAKEDILMQNNQSSILLQKNYPLSTEKSSIVADKIKKKEERLVYCPTDEMVADFSSKLFEGKMVVLYHNIIFGLMIGEFNMHKRQYKEAFERYDLWNEIERDLDNL